VRGAEVRCFEVQGEVMSVQRILVAVDGSPLAAHAADVGIELARLLSGELALIHVVDPVQNWAPESGVPAADLIKIAEQDGKRLLGEFSSRASLQAPPLEFVQIGKPAAEIVKAAKDWSASIIVIASHGRGGVSRLLLGSVAEGVMRHAPCPVLVVRARAQT
jgi:nucleotide-binding universal stress UspA family protein